MYCTWLNADVHLLLTDTCGMLSHSFSMAVRSCWILAGTETRCWTLRSRASQTCSLGDMSGEYAGHGNKWDIFSFQELSTEPCEMGPCIIMLKHEVMVADEWQTIMGLRISSRYLCAFIIMLKHEVMVVDEWHDNGSQDLITLSLCITITINKMCVCCP